MRSSTGSTAHDRTDKQASRSITQAATRSATRRMFEQLELRRMLAAGPFDFRNTPVFTPGSADLTNIKSGPLAKGGEGLVDLYTDYLKFVKKGGNRYQYESRAPEYAIVGRNLLVQVRTRGSIDELVSDVKEMGGTIVYRSKGKRVLEAFVPLNHIADLTAREEILHVRPQLRPKFSSAGSVGNDAERSQKTEFVVNAFGVDGSGQTVGVLSDSFGTNTGLATGDLPAVNVITDDVGTDEGRAMLELIHDLAPGADLAFNAVGESQNTFADGIRNLREAGSNIIVDDVSFLDEPFFGEGVIDRAINDVVEDGATYFTANANFGFAGYSQSVQWTDDANSDSGLTADFDRSSKDQDTLLDVSFNRAGVLYFQWDNAYDGVVANVTADVDFYVYRDGTLIASGIDDNFATGVPIEHITVPEGGDYEIVIRVAKLAKGADAPSMFKFISTDNDMFDARTDVEDHGGYHNATLGHAGATGAIPVGAVDNAASNAFGTTRDLVSQDFSSSGPQIRVFDANGNRLAKPEIRLTPLISGIQGTNTSVPGFAPFFGTSAAAPNVAAIAALLLEINPEASPDDIKDALVESAKSNPLNGAKAGEWDEQAGYGLVDALKAASIFDADTAVSTINVPTRVTNGVSSITIDFSEPVTGVDFSDFALTRDGTKANRFTGSETITSSNGGRTYTINNLKSATGRLGTYTLTLRNARTEIEDVDGNPAAGNVASFTVTLRKPTGLTATTLDDGKIQLAWNDTNTTEDSYRVQRATDSFFSKNVSNFNVDGTSYVDEAVEPGEIYYYRVRASKDGRLGDVARTSVVASSAGELFFDDTAAVLRGNWTRETDGLAYNGSKLRAGKTSAEQDLEGDYIESPSTATFTPSDVAPGSYLVYVRYTASGKPNNATFEIVQNGTVLTTVTVDQSKRAGRWVLLGTFPSPSHGGLGVRLTTVGAKGSVSIDGARFLPADEATIEAYQAQKAAKKKKASIVSDLV